MAAYSNIMNLLRGFVHDDIRTSGCEGSPATVKARDP